MNATHVRIRDPRNGQICEIPAAELAPGMVLVKRGDDQPAFEPMEGLKLGKETRLLPDGFEPVALTVWSILGPQLTWCPDAARWLNGFRADQEPVGELVQWMKCAQVWFESTHEGTDTGAVASDVFRVLVQAMTNGAHAIHTAQLARISRSRARSIISRYLSLSEMEFAEFWADRIDVETFVAMHRAERDGTADSRDVES